MTAVLKPEDPLMAAFTPAEGSYPIQTPYGSLQLNHTQPPPAITFLGIPGEGSEDEEEEDDDDDDDGTTKGKRKRSKSATTNSKGGKKQTAKAASATPSVGTSGERDLHTGRRKIRIEFIEDDSRRHITFSKRKAGIMKKVCTFHPRDGNLRLLTCFFSYFLKGIRAGYIDRNASLVADCLANRSCLHLYNTKAITSSSRGSGERVDTILSQRT